MPPATVDGEPDAAPVYRQLAPYTPPAPPVTVAQYQTGLDARDKVAQVFSFDDQDKCVRVQEFHDRGTALKAAGLSS